MGGGRLRCLRNLDSCRGKNGLKVKWLDMNGKWVLGVEMRASDLFLFK